MHILKVVQAYYPFQENGGAPWLDTVTRLQCSPQILESPHATILQ
jgi:hypothetical protein